MAARARQHAGVEAAGAGAGALSAADQQLLRHATCQIVAGYRAGTRFGIRMDEDGLLAAGVPGVQLGDLLRASRLVADEPAEEIAQSAQPRARAAV